MGDRIQTLEDCIAEVSDRTDADHLIALGINSFAAGAIAADYVYKRNLLEDLLDILQGVRAKHYPQDNHEAAELPYIIWETLRSARPRLETAQRFLDTFGRDIGIVAVRENERMAREMEDPGYSDNAWDNDAQDAI